MPSPSAGRTRISSGVSWDEPGLVHAPCEKETHGARRGDGVERGHTNKEECVTSRS